MPDQVRRAASSGDVAVFFLVAGLSPPIDSRVVGFTIGDRSSQTRDEVIKILNAAPKPTLCSARLGGQLLEITTEPITSPDALRVRQQYLKLASQGLIGLGESPPQDESEVLLISERDELVVSAALLRRFYDEYEIPHSSSQSQEDVVAYGRFSAVVRVGAAGSIEVYLEEHSTDEAEGGQR